MTVAHDTASESHTGTTGSESEASFTWNHTPVGTPRGVLVFTLANTATQSNVSSVTYGGVNLPAVTGGYAVDTGGTTGFCRAWFVGESVPTGVQAVVVNRTSNANVIYAVAITVTADGDTEIVGTPVLLQENGTLDEQAVDSGAVVAQRYAGLNSGLNDVASPGASSTALHSIDYSARTAAVVRETTAGSGSRSVGFTSAESNDCAAVHLAVAEVGGGGSSIAPIAMAFMRMMQNGSGF